MATGDFGDADTSNENSGFAKTGIMWDLSFAKLLNKNVGIYSSIRYSSYKFQTEVLKNSLTKAVGDNNFMVSSEDYIYVGVYVGPYISISIADNLSFDLKPGFGLINGEYPLRYVGYTGAQSISSFEVASKSTTTFSYSLAAGLKNNISDKLVFLFNLEYVSAKPEYETTTKTFVGSRVITNTMKVKSPYDAFNMNIGIGLNL